MTKKFDIAKFCGKDKMKPIFGGVHYENGRACASDAGVLAYVHTRYNQTNEGKTIHPNGYEIQGKYPNVSGLVESVSKQNTVCVKLDLALLVTACSWCKKDLFTIVSIPVPMPDGKIIKVGFDFKRLFLIVDACITFGIREARFSPVYTERKAMILSNAYADFLIMPVMREGDEISLDGTISLTIQRRSELAELAGVYERTAEASEGRKSQAAAKTAEYIRNLLEKADEGRWMDPAALYGPNEVAARNQPERAERPEAGRGDGKPEISPLGDIEKDSAKAYGVFVRKPGESLYKVIFSGLTGAKAVEFYYILTRSEMWISEDYAKAGAAYDPKAYQIRKAGRGVVSEWILKPVAEQGKRAAI